MTQNINPGPPQSQAAGPNTYVVPTTAESALVVQFAADQPLAEETANFTLFTSTGQVDGPATLAAQQAVLGQIVYLTVASAAGYGVSVSSDSRYFTTLMIDWTATKTQRLSYRLTNFGF